jgi:hypothetical protein
VNDSLIATPHPRHGFVGYRIPGDGSPHVRIPELFALHRGPFNQDTEAMTRHLALKHSRWISMPTAVDPEGQCGCHGPDGRAGSVYIMRSEHGPDLRWAYLLDGPLLHVLRPDSDGWALAGVFPWDSPIWDAAPPS